VVETRAQAGGCMARPRSVFRSKKLWQLRAQRLRIQEVARWQLVRNGCKETLFEKAISKECCKVTLAELCECFITVVLKVKSIRGGHGFVGRCGENGSGFF